MLTAALVEMGVEAIAAIVRQIALYSRPEAQTPEARAADHARIMAFMDLVQVEVGKRRSPEGRP
jgi:hypothetical protein